MKVILRRVSNMSIDNPDTEYKLPFADRYTRETKVVEINTLEELLQLSFRYECSLILDRPTKDESDENPDRWHIRLYDDYAE